MDHIPNAPFFPSKLSKAQAEQYSSSEGDSEDDDDFQIPSTDPNTEFLDYNPRKRRRTGRNAKESAALGIFGSESENDGPSSRWKHKNLRNKGMSFVSATANKKGTDGDDDDDEEDEEGGIAIKGGGDIDRSIEGEDEDDDGGAPRTMRARAFDEEDEDEDDEEDAPTAGLGHGLGFAAQQVAQDIGWSAGNGRKTHPFSGAPPKTQKSRFNANAPLGRGFVPSSSFQPELKAHYDDGETPDTPSISRPSAFSTGKAGKKNGGKANPNSFGARMMAKMGWEQGAGLGKDGQGRNVIVEVNLRPQRAGLGAVKEKTESERREEKRQARLRGETVIDSDEEEEKKAAARKKKLLAAAGGSAGPGSSAASTPKRQKPKYLTLDEVKRAAPGLNIPDAFTPILDLTGPGRKMLTSSSGLMTPTGAGSTTPGAATETTEQAESKRLARRAQNDFMAILEEWQGLQERKAYAELQLQQERQELEELEEGLVAYRNTVERLGRLSLSASSSASATENGDGADATAEISKRWDQVVSLLKAANDSIPASSRDTLKADLSSIAVAALHPILKRVLQRWEPLSDEPGTVKLAADIGSISGMLGLQPTPLQQQARHHHHHRQNHHSLRQHRRGTAAPYDTMMYKLWLPHVARAVREWNARDSDRLLTLYEAFSPLLPPFVRAHLLEQDIVRKLEEAVANWEPKRRRHHHSSHSSHSSSHPHLWLFPWLQHLPARHLDPKSSTGLVADVKRKFRQLIDVWDFSRGVVPGLAQWRDILCPSHDNDQWRPLVLNHVLPSMARFLRREFEVDPSDQEQYASKLTGVLEWRDLIAPPLLAEVLVAEVFPKWHDALCDWLLHDGVDYGEVLEWVEWWRSDVFSEPLDLRTLPSIAAELEKGLSLIDEALLLGDRAVDQLQRPRAGPAHAATPQRASFPPTPSRRGPPQAAETPTPQHQHHLSQEQEQQQPASFRDKVEEWCQSHDMQFIPERTKAHAKGPLYRLTARADGKGGVLAYLEEDSLCVDTARQGGGSSVLRVRTEEDFLARLMQLPALGGHL